MRSAAVPASTVITGRKMSTGTTGCTRESLSSRSESNIRGEAFSTSVRRASMRRI